MGAATEEQQVRRGLDRWSGSLCRQRDPIQSDETQSNFSKLGSGPKAPDKTSKPSQRAPGRWGAGARGHGDTGGHSGAVLCCAVVLASEGDKRVSACSVCPNQRAAERHRGETRSALQVGKCRGKLASLAARLINQR